MKTLSKLIVGTALALGAGCSRPTFERVEKVPLPESCVEVVDIVSTHRYRNGVYSYDINCKEREGKYQSYICGYRGSYRIFPNLSKYVYSCKPSMKFEQTR